MEQRNMMCTSQYFDMGIEQGHSLLRPDPCILLGNTIDFPNPNIHPVLPSSGNSANFDLHQLTEHNDSNLFYGNQYNNLQHHHPVSNLDLGCVPPPNFYHPYMIPSSSSSFFPVPVNNGSSDQIPSYGNHGVMGIGMDEYGRHHHFIDNVRGSCKRKNTEGVPGNHEYANSVANSSSSSLNLSLNSGLQHRDESSETAANLLDGMTLTPPEHRGVIMPMTEGPQRSVRSRPSTVSLQLESSVAHHRNHVLQGNHMGQSFQPVGNVWVEQFGSNVADGGSSNWNYTPAVPYMQGRSVNMDSLEIGNMPRQGHQDPSSSRNSTIVLHPLHLHNHHQHLPPVQGMPVQGIHGHSYSHHPQVSAPTYGHPMNNNLHHGILNPSRDGLDSRSRYPRPFPSSSAYRPPRRLPHAVPEGSVAHMRILPPENVAVLDFSGFYGVGNLMDQHRDMRLDIEGMSYEELLALEERIGDVNTGLSEESVLKNLKTRIHVSHAASSMSSQTSSIAPENGTCIICQVEYEENERIGTLDCGHNYHADCIRRWLLLKNLCPICKTSALAGDKRK